MKRQRKDIDCGYAWVVCVACFAIELLCGTLNSSPGVITPAILEEVDGDLVKVSWVGSTLLGTFSMCGPLAGIIQGRIGNRWTGILGGILMLLGLTAASFCRTVTGLILTFGVIAGLGCGLAANVSGVAPSNYFNKRLPVAYGICMSGGALGLLAIGPLAVQLLEMYTLSGALLILGGITFNVCLVGALIRPPSTLMQEESMSIDLAHHQEDTDEICDAQGDPTMTMQSQHNVLTVETTTVKFEQRDENQCSPANLPRIVKENSPWKAIGNIILHVGLQGMTAVSLLLLPVLSHTYSLQMIFSVLYGTYSQGPYTLVSPICIELIGRSKLAIGYGICSFCFGLGSMVGPPIASLIYESTGVYDLTFLFSGACFIISAFLALCIPLTKKPT
ncbi:monocarboxylate transporter 9-like isoform X3 [Haliotis rubra]|uniref:monocarboxylate transporter 9-like isoform X3 n=1 Tax=Haliotis rubra TaxID=36100 RepID=UPI001EE5D5CB|nr:monocarboxylate transporter 9-like isoform X3 [Haliotis rubra]